MTTTQTSGKQLVLYTDGSSRGNPGPGGYGAILLWGAARKELSAGFRRTTNNRMELMAVIKGLEALTRPGVDVVVYSDSKYVVEAVQKGWLRTWARNGFKDKKKPGSLADVPEGGGAAHGDLRLGQRPCGQSVQQPLRPAGHHGGGKKVLGRKMKASVSDKKVSPAFPKARRRYMSTKITKAVPPRAGSDGRFMRGIVAVAADVVMNPLRGTVVQVQDPFPACGRVQLSLAKQVLDHTVIYIQKVLERYFQHSEGVFP